MLKRFITIFILVILVSTSLLACTKDTPSNKIPVDTTPTITPHVEISVEELIINLVEKQEKAISTANINLMLSTIDISNTWLATETKNLVEDQKVTPVEDYSRIITNIKNEGDYWVGTITQNFSFQGEKRPSISIHKYIFDGTNVYDAGIAFDVSVWDQVTAHYNKENLDFAKSVSDTANEYIDVLQDEWDTTLEKPVSVKMFKERNVFLNSVKLTLPNWAGGWYEANESIKFYIRSKNPEDYYDLMRHETTHMILADVTNDNASYWLQEGFATTMPNLLTHRDLFIDIGTLKIAYATSTLPKVNEHIHINLETITDRSDVSLYYSFSNAMVIYMLEKMDKDTLLAFFKELASYPYIPVTVAQKIPETNERVLASLHKVTGQSFEEFYADFYTWLVEQFN